jgi:imidazolonepropionase-like amidohydrolase
VIDLSNSTVLPGLFDMHTHLCMDVQAARDAGRYYYTTLNDPDSFRSIQGVVNARTMLEAGLPRHAMSATKATTRASVFAGRFNAG